MLRHLILLLLVLVWLINHLCVLYVLYIYIWLHPDDDDDDDDDDMPMMATMMMMPMMAEIMTMLLMMKPRWCVHAYTLVRKLCMHVRTPGTYVIERC